MSLKQDIDRLGRFPPVTLRIKPLDGSYPAISLQNFLSYQFDSSMLVPVDSFSFSFAAPDDLKISSDYFREGDICELYANEIQLATGLIDQVEVEIDPEFGEKITVSGRDLMGQLEDQDIVSLDSATVFANQATVQQVYQLLVANTRIQNLRTQDAPVAAKLFATEPGESKLSALARFMEPLNIIAWMDPGPTLVIGRPNMAQPPKGTFVIDRQNRRSNCIGMKTVFAAATVPNIIVPIWVGQENVQNRVGVEQGIKNLAEGPARLLGLNHRLPKSVIVSNPQGSTAAALSTVNAFTSGYTNVLRAYAQREMARQNTKEVNVQVAMPGHLDGDGNPFKVDSTYTINFDRAFKVPLEMYCYQVQYTMSLDQGQRTNLFFTKKGTIVSSERVR